MGEGAAGEEGLGGPFAEVDGEGHAGDRCSQRGSSRVCCEDGPSR